MGAKRLIIDAKPSGRTFGSRAGGEGAKRAAGRSLSTPTFPRRRRGNVGHHLDQKPQGFWDQVHALVGSPNL